MWMQLSAFKVEGACKLTEHTVSKELLEPLVVDGTIRRRSRDEILRSLDLFTVVERESRVRPSILAATAQLPAIKLCTLLWCRRVRQLLACQDFILVSQAGHGA